VRIRLVMPKMSLRPMDSEYKRRMAPSLALLTLAALTPKRHHVTIEDENVAPIREDVPCDLVGISVNVDTSRRAYALASLFRERGIPVVLGGIHASANPDEARAHADAVCIGEAEPVWEGILRDAEQGMLKPVYRGDTFTDPARLPAPRWSLIDSSHYLCTNIISASRGCPFRCDFCYNSCDYVHHVHRPRPVPQVVEEIRRFPTPHVMFVDDNLIGDLTWARALVRALQPLDLIWHAAVSANIGHHEDLLDAMRDSGCRSLFIGFESINGQSIQGASKNQNRVSEYDRTIAAIHARGMMVNASLVFGFDGETTTIFPETLAWLIRNKVETMTAHILTPYPGTRLYRRLLEQGRIRDFDWSHYNTANVVFAPSAMTPGELLEGYLWMYRRFYSFANILKRTPRDSSSWLPYFLFNFGYRKFGRATSAFAYLGSMRAIASRAFRASYGVG